MAKRSLAICLLGSAIVAVALSAAQDPQSARRQILRSEANLVRVDVRVLSDGRLVSDLTAADFQVFEDGVRQQIDNFEFVRVAAPGSSVSIDPSNTGAMMDLAADPRNRLFVFFLDSFHVTQENGFRMPAALATMIDQLIGPSDLVGVMMPGMASTDLTLGRKTDVLKNGLLASPRWGRMIKNCHSEGNLNEDEQLYALCYPPPPPREPTCDLSVVALDLIRRRRESFTLGALQDVVRLIGARRDTQTVFVLVSEGWALYTPSASLANVGAETPPRIKIGIGGRLGSENPETPCEGAAKHLRAVAQIDDQQRFRDLLEDARRNNATFYVVDPGGLRTGGPPINLQPGELDPRGRIPTLRTLADNTSGAAIVNTNDLAGGLLRVADGLSGYYLLGYYSTNTKADGRYHRIEVKVTRPGVDVRARKGYTAFSRQERASADAARTAAAVPAVPESMERTAALARLARITPASQFYVQAVVDDEATEMEVAGELSASAVRGAEWRGGATVEIMVSSRDGAAAGTGRGTIQSGGRAFLLRIPLGGPPATAYDAVVRLTGTASSATLQEKAQVARSGGSVGEPIGFRSATRQNPVPSLLWSRTETARFEARLSADAAAPVGRLLDRMGGATIVPVEMTTREEPGARWAVASIRLAPLAPGDYLLELTAGSTRRLVPLRIAR